MKKLTTTDLLILPSLETPPTGHIGFGAKSDGLYQKIGTVETKLSIEGHTHTFASITDKPTTFPPSAHTLDSHSNVLITGNTPGEILKWNGSNWINNTLAEAGIATPADITNAISAIEIGGRNYIFKPSLWQTLGGFSVNEYTIIDSDGNYYANSRSNTFNLYAGQSYTLSFDVLQVDGRFDAQVIMPPSTNIFRKSGIILGRNIYTFTPSQNYVGAELRFFGTNQTTSLLLEVTNFKLERGTKATDWTPAPEDVDASINLVQTNLNTHISNVSNPHNVTFALLQNKPTTLSGYGITDGITGTGTANYLPKFTGASSIGNSVIYESGGKIGIGTTNPLSPLHVVNSNAGTPTIKITNTGVSTHIFPMFLETPNMGNNSTLAFAIGKSASTYNRVSFAYVHTADGSASNRYSVSFFGADNLLNVLANGNVGIGTTSPSQKLHVIGNAIISGTVTAPTFVGSLNGNASTATKLQTARTIAGVSFDGTANIAIPFANLASKPTTLSGYGITDGALKSLTLTAGNGLTGGGTLEANRTFALGTPSTLTSASTNAVTSTSHTHAITTTTVGAANTIVATDSSGAVRGNIIRIGGNWTLELSGTELVFKYNGVIKQRMLSDGSIVATGELTAYVAAT